jgi:hypothetical protein
MMPRSEPILERMEKLKPNNPRETKGAVSIKIPA